MKTIHIMCFLAVIVSLVGAKCLPADTSVPGKAALNVYVVWKQPHNPVPEDQYEIVIVPRTKGGEHRQTVGESGFAKISVDTDGVKDFVITITHKQTGASGTQMVTCPEAGASEQVPVYIGP
jgi:hypothetical protein